MWGSFFKLRAGFRPAQSAGTVFRAG
jgi:hypothetical protein